LAMSCATPTDAGFASGLLNTTVQVGGAVGLAVLATLSTEETTSRLANGESAPHALTAGYQLAFTIAAVLLVVAVVVAAAVLRPPARQEVVAGEPAYDMG
jgi:NADH:ubiquinone oxidoreductase subunit 6 (subunit J)